MISKLSLKITNILINRAAIQNEDKELYEYGFFILLSQILYFIIAIIIGIILNLILESIIFYFAFQFIRKYAGGYHAATETRCEIMSTLSIATCISVIKLSQLYNFNIVLLIISAISAVCIFVLCPLDTPEKPLSEKEFIHFRKISWLILLFIVILIVLAYCFKFSLILVPLCMSLILESVLLVAGNIKKHICKRNAH